MGRTRNAIPSYLRDRNRGRAVWTDANGKRQSKTLPGAFGSEESRKAFGRLVSEIEANGPAQLAPSGRFVASVLAAYLEHAKRHYRCEDGKHSSELREVKKTVEAINALYGDTLAAEFGPLALKVVRNGWVKAGLARSEINPRTRIARRIFQWAAAEELVPPSQYLALKALTGLQKGKTPAPEPEPVLPVADDLVNATLPLVSRPIRGLIEFQRRTGCRPGEACMVRMTDIDQSGPVWFFRPRSHKTAHRGKARSIAIGPNCQTLLAEFAGNDPAAYLFDPRSAVTELHAARGEARKTPRFPSHMHRNAEKRVKYPAKSPAERYTTASYGRAVERACVRGNLAHWHPNQLRHTFATQVRQEHGLEAAQVILGHARADVTQIYAERNEALAAAIAAKMG